MAQHPLTPKGGDGDFIAFKAPKGGKAKLDARARLLGYENRSELLRALVDNLDTVIGPMPDEVPPAKKKPKEDFSRAS